MQARWRCEPKASSLQRAGEASELAMNLRPSKVVLWPSNVEAVLRPIERQGNKRTQNEVS